ncbi:unnamed protein product [Cylindrotheca closterium]|uniref:16S rRNA (uracil(1498)-N(3))-methyltransferase n=1 Tax=Cylindrotheca closterium TaxID=2856 RepID=A0AAD2CL05_9STRA|nr:unnamed protein product [Cylindrotheca closterium]
MSLRRLTCTLQHLRTSRRGFPDMKIKCCYSSIAYFCLCYPTQSAALVGKNTNTIPITRHGSTITSYRSPCHGVHRASSRNQHSSRQYSSSIDVDGDLVAETSHLPRLYVESSSSSSSLVLSTNALISLSSYQSNYLSVMRVTNTKRWGQWAGHVRIFNGKDGEWLAKVVINNESSASSSETPKKQRRRRRQGGNSAGDSATILECVQQTIPQSLPMQQQQQQQQQEEVHLHMGKLKKQRRKWVLEKTTELGIAAIDVVDMEYSEPQKEPWEYEKHLTQVIEAAEQCERLTVPTLAKTPTSWSDLMESIAKSSVANGHHWLVCRERSRNETVPILTALKHIHDGTSSMGDHDGTAQETSCIIHILVGPEGGWSPNELEDLANAKSNGNKDNLHFVSLGSLVLRAETATISAVTATMLAMDQKRSS